MSVLSCVYVVFIWCVAVSYSLSVRDFISNLKLTPLKLDETKGMDFEFVEDDVVFKGHYPFFPVFPASLMVEFSYGIIDLIQECHAYKFLNKSAFYKGFSPGDLVSINIYKNGKGQLIFEYNLQGELATKLVFEKHHQNLKKLDSVVIESDNISYQDSYCHLPQRFPLLVVDKVYANKEHGSAIKNISYGDLYYQNAYGDLTQQEMAFSRGALIEGLEQSAVLLLAEHWDVVDTRRPIVVCAIDKCQFFSQVYPGDVVKYFSSISYISDDTAFISGYAVANGERIMDVGKLIVIRKEAI
ncbi:hypothetical protein [Pseudoalteromonas sp. OOF1S-7]|uniref:3-hydroxyacyl-ACP dehydratase FabZ family protein n=1 Tax=Pseudoalteromonas sp. OOF1S-7 TaxID=2917757 RepID=UPI001EF68324|nr:hypothetical protein [Pseudoalteromonas sp. OOF1S-7]MCG7536698.1 hypothetical protein [Pseudoalteromonas sp. OOF1S-7]